MGGTHGDVLGETSYLPHIDILRAKDKIINSVIFKHIDWILFSL